MKDFVHLHVHSEYSLLDGACRIKKLLDRVSDLSQKAVAITDHGVMYGVIDFYKAAKEKGIKPIIGCEVYVAPRRMTDRVYEFDSSPYHLVLLCENMEGYKNLIYLSSHGFTEGFYIKPRVDIELLKKHSKGLIALSACIAGEIPSLILKGNYESAKLKALELNEIFGPYNFFLELQQHNLPEQDQVNTALIRMSKETNIPLVVTNDAHYLTREDSYVQDVLMCIQMNKTVDDEDRMRFATNEFYIKSAAEMEALFPNISEAFDNTIRIADRCNVEMEFGKYLLPEFKVPENKDPFAHFLYLCEEGFKKRYPDAPDFYRDRLSFETEMIRKMGFVDYFLIVSDFISYAKSKKIPVGPGRGSAAGSMVSYCLGITDIDPIKYSLYFERFLNPERVSMPDIDIDFCYNRRQEVIDYVIEKYGSDHVAQIVTFGTMAARAAIRDVGRALNISYAEVDAVAKKVPFELHMTLERALSVSGELKRIYDENDTVKKLIDTAKSLEGMPRHASTHAAGVVITKNPVYETVPLSKNDESVVTQFPMTTLEELGLLKMDFLGLRTLTVIDDTVKMITSTDPGFNIDKINESDTATFKMLSQGKTAGVFQLESAGITNVVVGINPQSIEDITAVVALYRPGPMASIPVYIECKNNPSKVTFKHPLLKDILSVTYGCTVYQEQVMEVFKKLAGYPLGKADMVRRAMSKKKHEALLRERNNFIHGNREEGIDGALKNGVDEKTANEIFDDMLDFANYAFNKAHAAAYAFISYRTAYLKCHYPKEFMAALLTSVLDSSSKISEYINECRKMGITVLPPDINQSYAGFSSSCGVIRFGLVAVKNIGRGFIEKLEAERSKNGNFLSFNDFCERMYECDLNRKALENLIKCGAFDSMGYKRKQLIYSAQKVLDSVSSNKRKNLDGQTDLFAFDNGHNCVELSDVGEFPKNELLNMEKETTGIYISGHPLEDKSDFIKEAGAVYIREISENSGIYEESGKFSDGSRLIIAGVITSVKLKTTKSNSMMAYFTLEDETGVIELIAFSKVLTASGSYIYEDNTVFVKGKLDIKEEEEPRIICEEVRPLTKEDALIISGLNKTVKLNTESNKESLYIKIDSLNSRQLERAKAVMRMFPGNIPVIIYFEETGKKMKARRDLWVLPNPALYDNLKNLLGEKNVIIKRTV